MTVTSKYTAPLWLIMITLASYSVADAEIVNGKFSSGDFSGWTLFAEDHSFVPASPLLEVKSLSDGFAASFTTGDFSDDIFLQILQQSFTVRPDRPLLRFDATTALWSPDATGVGDSIFTDELFVTVGSNPLDQMEPILVDRFGLLPDPVGTATGLVTIGQPSQPGFDVGIEVDLSRFAGREVALTIDTVQQDDGFQLSHVAMGNFSMHPVPEPSSLLLYSLGLLLLLSRRSV